MTTRTALKAIDLNRLNPSDSFKSSYDHTRSSESNGCLMRITPLAVWGHRLPKDQLYQAVKLQTSLTHSNQIAIDASYLYCFAIVLLINGKTAKQAY